MQIMHGHGIEDGVRPKLVGLAVGDAALDAAARHEDGIAADMVVAASRVARLTILQRRSRGSIR